MNHPSLALSVADRGRLWRSVVAAGRSRAPSAAAVLLVGLHPPQLAGSSRYITLHGRMPACLRQVHAVMQSPRAAPDDDSTICFFGCQKWCDLGLAGGDLVLCRGARRRGDDGDSLHRWARRPSPMLLCAGPLSCVRAGGAPNGSLAQNAGERKRRGPRAPGRAPLAAAMHARSRAHARSHLAPPWPHAAGESTRCGLHVVVAFLLGPCLCMHLASRACARAILEFAQTRASSHF